MMSVQDTPTTVEDNSSTADLGFCIPVEELAVALYMLDMPDRRPKGDTWTLAQLAAWVAGGIEALDGISHVWHAAYRTQQAAKTADWMEYNLFRDDPRREKTARQAAAQITASGACN